MTGKASVSIVVLTYNQRNYTSRFLECVAPWLSNNPDSELIVVDNGSSDGTDQLIKESELIDSKQIKYIYNSSNLGVAAGRNIGMRAAVGDVILILDNDTEPTEDAIDLLRTHLMENPGCGLCAPALISSSGDVQDSAKPFPGLTLKIRHLLNPGILTSGERTMMAESHPFYVIGAAQMFRRNLIDRIGWLDDNIFYGPEDADWCMRIRATGLTVDYIPSIKIIHHWQRATNRSPFSRLSRLHIKALIYFYFKHHRFL